MIDKIVMEVKLGTARFENVVLPLALEENNARLSKKIISFY